MKLSNTNNYHLLTYTGQVRPPALYMQLNHNTEIIDRELQSLSDVVDSARDVGDRVFSLEEWRSVATSTIARHGIELENHRKSLKSVEADLRGIHTDMTSQDMRLEALEDDMSKVNLEGVELLRTQIATNANDIQALELRMTDDEESISVNTERIEALETATGVVPGQPPGDSSIDELRAVVEAIKASVEGLESGIEGVNRRLDGIGVDITNVQDALGVHSTQLETMSGILENLQGRMDKAEADIIALQNGTAPA